MICPKANRCDMRLTCTGGKPHEYNGGCAGGIVGTSKPCPACVPVKAKKIKPEAKPHK